MIHRIRTHEEFARLQAQGRRVRSELLWCTHLSDQSVSPARIGFSIGRAYGSAVQRNRLKRQLRSILSTHSNASDLTGHFLFGPVQARSEMLRTVQHTQLKLEVAHILDQVSGST